MHVNKQYKQNLEWPLVKADENEIELYGEMSNTDTEICLCHVGDKVSRRKDMEKLEKVA